MRLYPLCAVALVLLAGACERAAPSSTAGRQAHSTSCTERVKHSEEGLASWYGHRFEGKRTASGESFSRGAATAAHRTLPLGSQVKVTNLETGQSANVTINDRGPRPPSRIIDVTETTARELGFKDDGKTRVRVEALEPC